MIITFVFLATKAVVVTPTDRGLYRCLYSPNRREGVFRSYASISSTSGASSFSRAWKRRAGIWLAGDLRVEVVAGCLYSPSRREGGCPRKFRECGPLEFVLPIIAPIAPNPIGEIVAQDPTYSFSTAVLTTVEQPPRSEVIGPRVERELLVGGEGFVRI